MIRKKRKKAERIFFAFLSLLSPRLNTKLLFYKKFGRLPDLEHPATLNEKLLKWKLEEYGTNPVVRQCADKYRVREFVRARGLESCLNKLIAVYDSADEIDWAVLPSSFAMKWNFGCHYNIICPSKEKLDETTVKRQMKTWGREPFWAYFSELQYKGVDKKILVEEYIGTREGLLPQDYKFYCFHGHAHCVMLCDGREEGWPRFYFFDRNFQLMRINRDGKEAPEDFSFPRPKGLEEGFEIADRLSQNFPFVRVDLYLTDRGVRFGEMTFTPSAAMDNKRLPETDLLFGSML